MRKITKTWLKNHYACCSLEDMNQAEKIGDIKKIVNKLIKAKRLSDANWLITRYMNKRQNVMYAVFAATQANKIVYTNKGVPIPKVNRKAIEAAKRYLKSPTKKNKNAAAAARAEAYAAYAAEATRAEAYAAYAAAAAAAAAEATRAEAYAAYATRAATVAYAMKIKIIKHGIKIIYGEVKYEG